MTSPYDALAPYYDEVVRGRRDDAKVLRQVLKKYRCRPKTVLDLACGSGKLTKEFKNAKVTGIDLSPGMLTLAREQLPEATLLQADMRSLRLPSRFDAAWCMYDSMNHLDNFRDWTRTMQTAHRHLNPGGVFVFDVNTVTKLEAMVADSPFMHHFKKGMLVTEVSKQKSRYLWQLNIFERQKDDLYRLQEAEIPETAYETERILEVMERTFEDVTILDPVRKRPSKHSMRLYFAGRKAKVK